MASSLPATYAAKGWTAVDIVEEPPADKVAPIVLQADIRRHATHDRIGIWKRGDDIINSSCRNALSLITKGFVFVPLADSHRLRALAEARPFPPAAAPIADAPKAKK